MTPFRTLAALCVAAAFATVTAAQTPAAPAAAAPAPAGNPAHMPKCETPDPHPGRIGSPEKIRGWNKQIAVWQECMKKGIAELQAKADSAVKEANAAVADSNMAIAGYNDKIKEFQAAVEASK
jgi:hypothetical protein